MRFQCQNCKAKYNIADEKVRNKVFKIRCKKCGNVLVISEHHAELAEIRLTDPGDATVVSETPLQQAQEMAKKPEPLPENSWYVGVDGQQTGPFSVAEMFQRFYAG